MDIEFQNKIVINQILIKIKQSILQSNKNLDGIEKEIIIEILVDEQQ